MPVNRKRIFRIYFTSLGKSYEIYARKVDQAELYGFVEIEELLFGEKSSIVVDPSEEGLKKEFSGVRRLLLPFQSISRIEEVEKEGAGKILSFSGTGVPEPTLPLPPGKTPGRD